MLFNSVHFLWYFPLFLIVYFTINERFRWMVLLAASIYFYMSWKPEYVILLGFCTVLNYYSAILIHNESRQKYRYWYLVTSVILNLSVIVVFKYLGFFTEILNSVLALSNAEPLPIIHLLLPVGISFYTFHTMSYTIDVYKNETPVEKHFGYFSLFVSFWPMLLAGPIERSNHLIPQFRKKFVWDYERIMMATNRISFGFFKKMVVADRLSMYVNEVYANLDSYGTLPIIIAAIFFSIQIYCDFSGYCDIAIGVAMIIDFDLFENFNRPYTATSIKDFWSRWHMSLSRWFRDYVYIPLGGNRVSEGKKIRNLMVTFLVSGLWHGANFTYIFWGALHGVYQVIGTYTESFRTKVRTTLGIEGSWLSRAQQTIITFILVTFAWIFFRAKNFDHAFQIIGKIAAVDYRGIGEIMIGKGPFQMLINVFVIALLVAAAKLPVKLNLKYSHLFIVACWTVVLLLGEGGTEEFIYFQF